MKRQIFKQLINLPKKLKKRPPKNYFRDSRFFFKRAALPIALRLLMQKIDSATGVHT